MLKHFRCTLAWAALLAWVASSGVSADLLQVFAYVNMTATRAQTMSASAAFKQALQDEPCELCRAAAAARQAASSQAPLTKDELIKVKTPSALWVAMLPLETPLNLQEVRELPADRVGPRLIREVPVPPPKV